MAIGRSSYLVDTTVRWQKFLALDEIIFEADLSKLLKCRLKGRAQRDLLQDEVLAAALLLPQLLIIVELGRFNLVRRLQLFWRNICIVRELLLLLLTDLCLL